MAGYELTPELASAIDGLKAVELAVTDSPVHWFEIVAEPGRPMTPDRRKSCKRVETK